MQWTDRIGHRLKLRDLHIVMTIAQHGSMGKAAAILSISQPAISKAVADLEHTLRVKLFDRTASGAELTQYGRTVVKWGNAVFDDLRQSVNELEHLSDPSHGEMRLGCTEPMASGFVPAIIGHLSRQNPKMVFQVSQADPATLQIRLQNREIEVAIGRIPPGLPPDLFDSEILFQEPVFVASSGANPLTHRRKVNLAELTEQIWSLPPPGAIAHSTLTEAFDSAKLQIPRSTVVTFSLQVHCAMMATCHYLGLVPGSMLHFNSKRMGLAVVPVNVPLRPGPAGVFTLKNRTRSAIAERFIKVARELSAPLKRMLV